MTLSPALWGLRSSPPKGVFVLSIVTSHGSTMKSLPDHSVGWLEVDRHLSYVVQGTGWFHEGDSYLSTTLSPP